MNWWIGTSRIFRVRTRRFRSKRKGKRNEFVIELAAPAIKKNYLKIKFHNNVLTVSSEKKDEKEEKNEKFTRKEFSYQSFQRSFTVAENAVESDKISAKYADGILLITLPKREVVKPKPMKEINIS